ncbi:MAG: aminodeoxychorismate synthase component I [Acidobacteria bacterium]|nr:aminodeoxychorismate synthase component I [Acidobacteriota bacterium]
MNQRKLNIKSANDLVGRLLRLAASEELCLLDSAGAKYAGSRFLICGLRAAERIEICSPNASDTVRLVDEKISSHPFSIFTFSYDFGLKLQNIESRHRNVAEPDVFLALFDCLLIHDYDCSETRLIGDSSRFDEIEELLSSTDPLAESPIFADDVKMDVSRADYLADIASIHELIRSGSTYQTNLTHPVRADLPAGLTPADIFSRLRRTNPAPFSAYIQRTESTVVSTSPERFFSIDGSIIEASPIKGTRPRGTDAAEDKRLRVELEASEKDRAENVMIVDLLRNDLGRVCEFGSVAVLELCAIEEHPTIFHLVSTIRGSLRQDLEFSDILRALFPCGSITGAPKISTMNIIDSIERSSRGLSMGAIGYYARDGFGGDLGTATRADLSVAIRTMVVRAREAVFNVGGGIVIDSEGDDEYRESLAKARALIGALCGDIRRLFPDYALNGTRPPDS